jgi:hypothetical protein
MKKIILPLIFLCSITIVHAQVKGMADRIKQRIKDRTALKINTSADNTVDSVFTKTERGIKELITGDANRNDSADIRNNPSPNNNNTVQNQPILQQQNADTAGVQNFKRNTEPQNFPAKKPADKISNDELPKINIADAITYKSDKGQKAIEVVVLLSKAATKPVTVNYSTKNGTAKAGVDYVATSGSISFEPGERMKKLTVFSIGEAAADADEDAVPAGDIEFWVNLNNSIGGIIENGSAIITLMRNLARDPRLRGNEAIYEVEINFVGYTSFSGTPADCGIRPNGAVTLTGILAGHENLKSDDDIVYTGTLQMFINIDICSMDRKPGTDEDRFCGMTVFGSGTVFTELEINYDSDFSRDASGNVTDSTTFRYDGRGGYIKIENKDGRFRKTVEGDCEAAQIDEEWTMVPNKSISSIFNGKDLPMLVQRTLKVGTYRFTDDQGNITQVRVIRKIL